MNEQEQFHGEVIGGELREAIPDRIITGLSEFSKDTPEGMKPVMEIKLKAEDGTVEKEQISVEDVEGVEATEEPGKYNLLRSKIIDNKKVIIPIALSGAALLALYASRRYKRK
jgi:hypothetical protein